jgi:5-methylcytosine-specific restriction protein B
MAKGAIAYTFTIGGEEFSLSADDVERKLKGVTPEPIQQVYVEVSGKKFPVKQALGVSASMIRSSFTTQNAVRVLRKLGFKLGEV